MYCRYFLSLKNGPKKSSRSFTDTQRNQGVSKKAEIILDQMHMNPVVKFRTAYLDATLAKTP